MLTCFYDYVVYVRSLIGLKIQAIRYARNASSVLVKTTGVSIRAKM